MNGPPLRQFALTLLDDEHGINRQAWDVLSDLLYDDEQKDILNAVRETEGRFYLPSETVNQLRMT